MMGFVTPRSAGRIAFAALCLFLIAAVSLRVFAWRHATAGSEATAQAGRVDLGYGIMMPRTVSASRDVLLGDCWAPVPVETVEPLPHGRDQSLVVPHNDGDRVFYVYQGWLIGGRFASTAVSALDVVRRAGRILTLQPSDGSESLAAKFVIPAACNAAADDVLNTLRRDVLTGQ